MNNRGRGRGRGRRRGNPHKIAEKLAENGQESLINESRGRGRKNVDKQKEAKMGIGRLYADGNSVGALFADIIGSF